MRKRNKYLVKRDTREKAGGWFFPESDWCEGTCNATLKTGDYTLEGFEEKFCIERKKTCAEFAMNVFQDRFERELCRLDEFEHPYLVLEFTFEEIINFPWGSGVPRHRWNQLKTTPQLLLKRLHEIQIEHPKVRICFVGTRAREFSSSLFKRIIEHYERQKRQA